MPINLGNGLVTGNIILRTGNSGGGGGGGASVNVPANSILFSSTGTDICGNSGLEYDGDAGTINLLDNYYLNGNLARIGDYYYDSTVLLLFVDNDENTIDNSFYKKTITYSNISYTYESIFKDSFDLTANFDGTTSYVSAVDTKFNLAGNRGTSEFMFKFADTTTVASIFTLGESGNNQHLISLQANTDSTGNYLAGGLSLFLITSGWSVNPIWDTTNIDTSKWYYFALTIDTSSSYKVYFGEGYPNKTAIQQTISTPVLESYTNPEINIGASLVSGNYFKGQIANFRVTSPKARFWESSTLDRIQIPSYFFPKYNIGLNTNNAYFKVEKDFISNRLRLFIGSNDTASGDTVIGCNSMTFNGGSSNSENLVIGNGSLRNIAISNVNRNIIIGYNTITNATGTYQLNNIIGSGNTANASSCNILGNSSSTSIYTGCSILGNSATVTGSNQNQIGGSGTTTYVYGTVQSRSDIRDKADITDIPIGINFINKLKPKFYRWNYREDYIEHDLSGNEIQLTQDGSKKRTRFHAGLIAQDVKESMNELSIDFGLYQDHQVNGGKDVKTLGYGELIPVLIKAVQELSAKNTELESRIRILENK